jgi:Zn finger protein HypA/HybF involved in hydrogenase expression
MHEISIAMSILDAVKKEAELHAPGRPVKVGVRIGEMTGVDPGSLAFSFEAVVAGSGLEPLTLDIQTGIADELVFSYLEMEDP